jgi:hypothetical protein
MSLPLHPFDYDSFSQYVDSMVREQVNSSVAFRPVACFPIVRTSQGSLYRSQNASGIGMLVPTMENTKVKVVEYPKDQIGKCHGAWWSEGPEAIISCAECATELVMESNHIGSSGIVRPPVRCPNCIQLYYPILKGWK